MLNLYVILSFLIMIVLYVVIPIIIFSLKRIKEEHNSLATILFVILEIVIGVILASRLISEYDYHFHKAVKSVLSQNTYLLLFVFHSILFFVGIIVDIIALIKTILFIKNREDITKRNSIVNYLLLAYLMTIPIMQWIIGSDIG